MATWELNDADRAMIAREVEPFLPDRVFDAHAHLFRAEHYAPAARPAHQEGNPERLGLDEYLRYIDWIHPHGRTVGGLFFGLAFTGDRAANNRFVADEVAAGRARGLAAFGQLIVAPDDDPDHLREQVRAGGFVGLKCYHTLARVDGPTWLAPIEAYLTAAPTIPCAAFLRASSAVTVAFIAFRAWKEMRLSSACREKPRIDARI